MDPIRLPDTNSPEVMDQAVSIWLTHVIWEQISRVSHPDEVEDLLLGAYSRIYKTVKQVRSEE